MTMQPPRIPAISHVVETRIDDQEFGAMMQIVSREGWDSRSEYIRHLIRRELRQRAMLPE